MVPETTIPLLPCARLNDVLDFYLALGFQITFQQARPNNYAVVERGDIELHFFSMRDYEPKNSYSTCYVRTDDVDELYQAMIGGLRQKLGKVPTTGIPRVIPLKTKTYAREFILVDPGGNWIRIGQPMTQAPSQPKDKGELALEAALLLSDSKGDLDGASRILDKVLEQNPPLCPTSRLRALVARSNIALSHNEPDLARRHLQAAHAIALDPEERAAVSIELEQASDIAAALEES